MADRSAAANARALVLDEGKHRIQRGVHEGRAHVRAAPFDAIELDLGTLWI